MKCFASLRQWAYRIKRDVVAGYFVARDPEAPYLVRVLAIAVAAYALSPIDLIPDFIPILGYLDDIVIVPLGLLLVIRLLPPHVMLVARCKAQALLERPRSCIAAVVIVCIWLLAVGGLTYWFLYQ